MELIRKKNQHRNLCWFVLTVFIFSAKLSFALGDLIVTPTRVIFEGRDRSQTINLVNRGNKTATYRIHFTEMAMDNFGDMTEIETPALGQHFASNMVRYSPRQAIIEPGGSQTIRLMIRKPTELPAGEYRSHLLMYAVPDASESNTTLESIAGLKPKEVGIKLNTIFRVAIPVIVREGESNTKFNFSNLNIKENKNENTLDLDLTLERDGNQSIYGDIDVVFTPTGKNTKYTVGKIKDFVVYVPNKKRSISMSLHFPKNITTLSGQLNLKFTNVNSEKPRILATSLLKI